MALQGSHVLLNLRRLAIRQTQLDQSFRASGELDSIGFSPRMSYTVDRPDSSTENIIELREMHIMRRGVDLISASRDTSE